MGVAESIGARSAGREGTGAASTSGAAGRAIGATLAAALAVASGPRVTGAGSEEIGVVSPFDPSGPSGAVLARFDAGGTLLRASSGWLGAALGRVDGGGLLSRDGTDTSLDRSKAGARLGLAAPSPVASPASRGGALLLTGGGGTDGGGIAGNPAAGLGQRTLGRTESLRTVSAASRAAPLRADDGATAGVP